MKINKIIVTSIILILTAAGGLTFSYMSMQSHPPREVSKNNKSKLLGNKYENILSQTCWQGTRGVDAKGNDFTKENIGFIGLAKYDDKSGFMSFLIRKREKRGETKGHISLLMTEQNVSLSLVRKNINPLLKSQS